jgi:hypothetical protein
VPTAPPGSLVCVAVVRTRIRSSLLCRVVLGGLRGLLVAFWRRLFGRGHGLLRSGEYLLSSLPGFIAQETELLWASEGFLAGARPGRRAFPYLQEMSTQTAIRGAVVADRQGVFRRIEYHIAAPGTPGNLRAAFRPDEWGRGRPAHP